MYSKHLALMFTALLSVASVADSAAPAQSRDAQVVRADSRPRLLQRLQLGVYGSKYARIGDLDGDGVLDILFAQTRRPQEITCLTAIDHNGKILWQRGKPDVRNIFFTCDFPLQIHDWDRDGRNEVVYMPDENNVLTVLDGKTGRLIKQEKLEGGHDSLLFADFSGNAYAQDMLVKDRYKDFWVYDKNLELLWSKHNCNTGHYPMEYDFDGDGKDELLCGYTLYGHDGEVLWSKDLPDHNDDYYLQHVDCYGDQREEILCYNHKAVYIWTNGAPTNSPLAEAGWKPTLKKQPARVYNTNFYPGRL